MLKLRTNAVFVPGGMPQHTYVARTERDLEGKLRRVADNLCKLATLTGSTKSGKTVLANRVFPRTNGENIWIDGGTVKSENDLWTQVISELGGHTSAESSNSEESSQGTGGGTSGSLKVPFVASGTAKVDVSAGRKTGTTDKKSIALAPRPAAIAQLRDSGKPLIIDDFHYLDRKFQGEVIRALKPLVFEGHPVIIIAIPHRRYDAVKVEREMTGRVESISVPAWSAAELKEIPKTGFPLLNLEIFETVSSALAQQANGSPHLMQEFCRSICNRENVAETVAAPRTVQFVHDDLFKSIAEGTGKVIRPASSRIGALL